MWWVGVVGEGVTDLLSVHDAADVRLLPGGKLNANSPLLFKCFQHLGTQTQGLTSCEDRKQMFNLTTYSTHFNSYITLFENKKYCSITHKIMDDINSLLVLY